MTPTALKLPILTAVRALLRPLGYRKASGTFQRSLEEVVHMVEVQGSRSNVAGNAEFTVNVGVFVPALVYADVREFTKPSVPTAHWRMRLGELVPLGKDLWWRVSSLVEADAAAAEICELVERKALPALARIHDLRSLASLWQAGQSPGLTEHQRTELLSRLSAASSS